MEAMEVMAVTQDTEGMAAMVAGVVILWFTIPPKQNLICTS